MSWEKVEIHVDDLTLVGYMEDDMLNMPASVELGDEIKVGSKVYPIVSFEHDARDDRYDIKLKLAVASPKKKESKNDESPKGPSKG
tara:strand:- start:9438 stop:9695 length:258 start_codon:yes stop_codon:yes gene_type:complete